MIASTDLAEFQGATASGSIPINERLLNDLANAVLSNHPGRIRQVAIQIGRDNYLQVGVQVKVGPFNKWFRPEFVVSSTDPPGYVVLEIATPEYAGFLWIGDVIKGRLPRGLTIQNRRLVLDLSAIPDFGQFARHLRRLQITSVRGSLLVSFELRIDS
jgi:hypothetical protein